MNLRKLLSKDAPFMLEWMHDPSVVKDLQANFAAKTLDDCLAFIRSSADTTHDLHLAIVDDKDEYMGTVSLKHIQNAAAEFAITIRACAMGKGYSAYGMQSIIRKGFEDLSLNNIYWCVSPKNQRAVRFYDKHCYPRVSVDLLQPPGYTPEQRSSYIWYAVTP